MNIGRVFLFRPVSMAVLVLSMIAFSVPSSAETRSGFWTHLDPTSSVNGLKADFSELRPFCGITSPCTLKVADVDFSSFGSVRAPGGILFDSALGAVIQAEYLSGKTMTLDREGLFYLDSMMKKRTLTAPMAGYADSCPLNKNVYFLKTSEHRFAIMAKVGEYIGGINRTYYYWAYRPENDSILYKTALFETPESLSIGVDVFSGRPNPVFMLRDPAGIAEIVHQIYVSVNTLLDPSVKRTETLSCSQGLGYRKLTVAGMFGPDNPSSSYMPTLEICGGGITYYKVSPVSSALPPQLLYDPARRLEKLIIRVCCRLGLTVTDSSGEVQFCALIPDSLKDFNYVKPGRRGVHGNGAVEFRRLSGDRIVYSVKKAGVVRIEVLDTRGKRVGLVDQCFGPGEHTVALHRRVMGAGVYLLRVRTAEGMVETTIPLVRH